MVNYFFVVILFTKRLLILKNKIMETFKKYLMASLGIICAIAILGVAIIAIILIGMALSSLVDMF